MEEQNRQSLIQRILNIALPYNPPSSPLTLRGDEGGLRLVSPEMVKIELRITCTTAEMVRHKFLHCFLSNLSPLKIELL